jgi:hypothetical protein
MQRSITEQFPESSLVLKDCNILSLSLMVARMRKRKITRGESGNGDTSYCDPLLRSCPRNLLGGCCLLMDTHIFKATRKCSF